MPADHVIRPAEKFRAALRQAVQLVDKWPGRIVLFGIKPTYPAEIFGYIHREDPIPQPPGSAPTFQVKQFREKPDAATAQKYLASVATIGIQESSWRATTILNELRVRRPEMVRRLERLSPLGHARTNTVSSKVRRHRGRFH
jgi:mannose-1-phosphate guanylyltransferase